MKKTANTPLLQTQPHQVKVYFFQLFWYHYLFWRLECCCWYSTDNFADPQSSLVTQQQAAWQRPPGGRFGSGGRGNRSRLAHGRRRREKIEMLSFIKYRCMSQSAPLFQLYLIPVPQDVSRSAAAWAKKRHCSKMWAVPNRRKIYSTNIFARGCPWPVAEL